MCCAVQATRSWPRPGPPVPARRRACRRSRPLSRPLCRCPTTRTCTCTAPSPCAPELVRVPPSLRGRAQARRCSGRRRRHCVNSTQCPRQRRSTAARPRAAAAAETAAPARRRGRPRVAPAPAAPPQRSGCPTGSRVPARCLSSTCGPSATSRCRGPRRAGGSAAPCTRAPQRPSLRNGAPARCVRVRVRVRVRPHVRVRVRVRPRVRVHRHAAPTGRKRASAHSHAHIDKKVGFNHRA